MPEQSPYEEERDLEERIDEELLLLLAAAFLKAQQSISPTSFTRNDFQGMQEVFRNAASKIIPELQSVSREAVEVAFQRLPISTLSVDDIDFSDPRFRQLVTNIFEDNIGYLMDTNEQMFNRLQEIAQARGWSEEQLARYLKKFYGIVPNHVTTVLSMEDALKAEKVSNKTINERVQKRVDDLVEWRVQLSSALVGTEVVEGSKDLTYTILGETGQLDSEQYIKQWFAVVDSRTTQVCLNSHLTTAEIGGFFPNGFAHPPALNPLHPCRSSMRIVRRF